MAEKFSFCLNTLLSDISVCCPESRDEIITTQVEVLGVLTNMVKNSKESNVVPPIVLCKATVPLLLGLGRSMGRYANDPPLLCRLFPVPEKPAIKSSDPNQQAPSSDQNMNFRPIIPRSMSGLSIDSVDKKKTSTLPRKHDQLRNAVTANNKALISYFSVPYDPTTYFFTKYGSSFNQFPNMRSFEHYNEDEQMKKSKPKIQFPINHLQTIFALSKKILTKEILEHLDEQAGDMYALNQIKPYGYKTFSETINLVMVTLLREILQNQTGNDYKFFKKILFK